MNDFPDFTKCVYWILDENKEPISVDLETGQQWRASEDRTRVDYTEFDGDVEVSTIFFPRLALPGEHRPACLFETHIIRKGRHEDFDLYPSWKAAEKGHQRAVDQMLAEGRTIVYTWLGPAETQDAETKPVRTLH